MNDGENNLEKLIGALRHPEPQTRLRAAWLLGVKKDAGAVAPLVKSLGENRDDPYILATIATALGMIGDIRALDEVMALLKHSYPVVRTAAAEAIGLLGNVGCAEPLKSALKDRNMSVRRAAAKALKNLTRQS
ncbi:HEAT repeat domain-containing protein [Pelotomaculum propionicicum]|uniref:HEAT repeat domain-containing protein n=1 Tax=Pelotomaculum propionicicum TaxID=258475 RepID=A0A4Y7RMC3_9FIRM|nr:HEAT repeat domain-containing protein [Pelotomaculum propionicicum]NLI12262.1 HEAT repeat domain-containing protein [Peptococcaceae bacterium]TEB09966.1 hypothetical protein Pmgp_02769 [Pelotomaculum propionicicum]